MKEPFVEGTRGDRNLLVILGGLPLLAQTGGHPDPHASCWPVALVGNICAITRYSVFSINTSPDAGAVFWPIGFVSNGNAIVVVEGGVQRHIEEGDGSEGRGCKAWRRLFRTVWGLPGACWRCFANGVHPWHPGSLYQQIRPNKSPFP